MHRHGFPPVWARAVGLLVLGLVLLGRMQATPPTVAELERLLAQARPDDRAGVLARLSAAVEPEDTNRAWDYAQEARQAAQTPADEVHAETRLASIQRRRGNYAEALALAEAAVARAEILDPPAIRAEALLVLAHTHISLANFSAALDLFRTLVPLAEVIGDPSLLARVHNTMGTAYADAEQPDRSLAAYETALVHARKADDRHMVASLLNNLGNVAMETGDAPSARRYHEQALALRLSLNGDTRGVADSNQNLGHVSLMEEKPADALPYFDRAISLYLPLGLKRNLINAQVGSIHALTMLGRFDEVPARLATAHQHATELDSPTILVRVHRAAATFHEARGDFRAALEAQRLLAAATDRAIGEKSRQRLDALQARFDAEQREHEIAMLRRDQILQQTDLAAIRWQRYSLALILCIVVALAIAIISRQRLKNRAKTLILAETRASRDAAEAANGLKTRLLGMVSHDIRGPISGMLHLAEEVGQDHPAVARDERFNIILEQGRQVLHLAEDLLDAAALEAGQIKLETRRADLNDIVRTALAPFHPAASRKGQSLEFIAPPKPCEAACDPPRISQVVANLVGNAIKFSPRKTTIRVSLEREADLARIRVSDQGPGIAPDKLASLFLPFTRLASRPTGGESSHGLGLSIAHDLVELHGGSIRVDSVPGHGATFIVEFPTERT